MLNADNNIGHAEWLVWQKGKLQAGSPACCLYNTTESILLVIGKNVAKMQNFNLNLLDRSTRSNVFNFTPLKTMLMVDGKKANFAQKPPELITHLLLEVFDAPRDAVMLDICGGTGAFPCSLRIFECD
jgi:hypothetical protein